MGGGFERRPGKTSLVHETYSHARPASTTPGKRTLTEQLPPRPAGHPVGPDAGAAVQRTEDPGSSGDIVAAATAPVQRSAGTSIEHDDSVVTQLAAQGVAGGGGPLPYGDAIQQAFGHHDVSGVEAHVGGAAETASRGIGAEAYATGNHVAFAGAPSLHTAAHEAAHVVQQRGGVQLKGGVGEAGDRYEQHADQVADRVVAGQSAESLLDQVAGGGAATAVVQRRSEPGALVSATEYLKLNDRAAGDAIMRHLLAVVPPKPHPRLAWHNVGAFYQRLFKQLDRIVYTFENPTDLAQLVHPQDPYATVDAVRPVAGKRQGAAVGSWDWQPSVGTALAELIEEALVASLHRIGPRWLHVAELAGDVSGTGVLVDPDAIPRSHSMDRAVVPALCQHGVLEVLADQQHKAKPTSSTGPLAQSGLRPVQYVWLGKETRELWNWVRATSPADATVEEVSAQLFNDTAESHGEKHGDYLAFAMTSAPPLFGLPGHWAIKFDGGKAYAPATVPASTDESANNLVTLAGSSLADDQALREANIAPDANDAKGAKPIAGTGAAVGTLAQDALSQATYLKQTLASWHLDPAVDPALTFLGRRMGELADASKLAKWRPVLAGQKDKLSRIGAGIVEIDRAVATIGLSGKQADDARPLRDILRLYASAAGASHLVQTSEALLQRATTLQATLPLRGIQSATRDLGASADMLRDSAPPGDPERDRLSGAAVRIDEDAHKLQSSMMRGAKVDPDEIDRVTVDAGEIALKSKVHAIAVQLDALEKAANDAGDGLFAAIASLFSGDFRGLGFETQVMKDNLETVTRDMDWQAHAAGLGMHVDNAKDLDDHKREVMRVRKEALARAQGRFATMATNDRIKNFLSKGATLVKWQSFRTACVKLAVMIGVSIVGGALGGMVARGVGSMLMTTGGVAAVEDLSMGAQMIARGYGLVTETVVTSVGQTAIFGDKLSDSFLENMLMSLGSAGILKAIGHQAETLAQVERASEGLWAKTAAAGKLALKEGAAITGHTIMGAALGYVSHKLVTGKTQPPPKTLEEWLLQGASIAVGRYVGKAMEARAANARRLATIKGFAAGQKLLAATTALHEHALRAEANPQAKEAAEILARRHEVLADEIKALDELEKSPELMKASGLHLSDVKHMRGEVRGQLAEVHSRAFAETSLHLAGLEELIPGAQWKGSHAQILAAIESAKHAGVRIDAKPPQGDGQSWHVEFEGRPLEIVERGNPHADAKQPARGLHDEHTGAAEKVPASHFVGTGAGRRAVSLPEIQQHAEYAAVLLNNAGTAVTHTAAAGPPFFNTLHNGEISIVVPNGPAVRVKLERMAAGDDVARHNYRKGEHTCTVFISEKARPQDLTRALAHELAEIGSVAAGAEPANPSLRQGSASEQLDAHDVGRKAEIQVLLYQAERAQAERTPVGDNATELQALVKHLGFDPKTIATDARAKRLLGEAEVARVDEVLNKPRIAIKAGEYKAVGRIDDKNLRWIFEIMVRLPNGNTTSIADGVISLKPSPTEHGKFVPDDTATLDFILNNEARVDGRNWRVKLEGQEKLTDYVIKEAIAQFEKEFHSLPSLGGSLAWDNKAKFQHAYAEVVRTNPGISQHDAAQAAILKTPYGDARNKAEYDINVEPSGSTQIVTGDPPRVAEVPENVKATAQPRPKK